MLDDKQRIALVETETITGGNRVNAPVPLQRHQLGNHLGSASVELAADGALISYEEYHPYGTTAFQAGRSAAEVSLKRYRYSGKERDEETSLAAYEARYYAPWLGRWTSCDPHGVEDGPNIYVSMTGNPISKVDLRGTATTWWDETISGIETAKRSVKQVAQMAGDRVIANTEREIDRWGVKNSFVKGVLQGVAVLEATVVATTIEVAADIVMIGPNTLAGLDSAGKNIGEGAAQVWEAKNSEDRWLGVAQVSGGIGEAALVTAGVLSLGEGAAIRPGASTTPGMTRAQINRAVREQFTRFERQVTEDASSLLTRTAEQVTIDPFTGPVVPGASLPPTAPEVVLDTVQKQRLSGATKLLDAKSSATATLTPNQTVGYPLLEQFGGVVRGGAGGTVLPAGTIVPPTPVQIVRPTALIAKKALQASTGLTADDKLVRH